jgi:hypothetical protein
MFEMLHPFQGLITQLHVVIVSRIQVSRYDQILIFSEFISRPISLLETNTASVSVCLSVYNMYAFTQYTRINIISVKAIVNTPEGIP